jgi:hypothetical protein
VGLKAFYVRDEVGHWQACLCFESRAESTGRRSQVDRAAKARPLRGKVKARGAATLVVATGSDAQALEVAGTAKRPTTTVRLIVNGEGQQLDIDERQSLLDALRETLDLTGTKKAATRAHAAPAPFSSAAAGLPHA